MQVPVTSARKSGNAILRVLKWSALASVVILAWALAILGRDVAFERLSPQDRRLAIYDAFWVQITKHYFDPQFSGVDLNRMRQEWREKAAAASSDLDLYVNVLENIARGFPASHIAVHSPSKLPLPASPPNADPKQTTKTQRLVGLWLAGPGFDKVLLRRGTRAGYIVGDIVPGSAADRAGIEPGWIVWTTTISSTQDTVHFAGEFLRLAPEQEVEFERTGMVTLPETDTSRPDDNRLAASTIKVEYDLVPLPTPPPLETRLLPGGGLYIRFDTFADSKVIDQVLALLDQVGPEGIVIDVRRNIGGEEDQLRRLLDGLLESDSYVGTERSRGSLHNWRTSKRVRRYSGPLVVLIGPITASAAEIFAAAVKDNARGPLLGRMSNGSVLKGHLFPLPDGGQVQVPVSEFVRTGDTRIEGVGVDPDIYVIPSPADIHAGRDPVVERAELVLRNISRGDAERQPSAHIPDPILSSRTFAVN